MNYKLLFELEVETNQTLAKKVVELRQALGSALTMNTKIVELLKKFEQRVNELETQLVVKDKELTRVKQEGNSIGLPTMETYKYM